MAKISIKKRSNWLTVLLFQLCIITNNVFGNSIQLFTISKVVTLLFFCAEAFWILRKGKISWNQILLIPILFTVYCAVTVLWAYKPTVAMSQMLTQIQLVVLLIFTFWAMSDGVTVLDYLNAVYVSGFGLVLFALIHYGGLEQYTDAMLDGERMGQGITNLNTFGMVFGNAAISTACYFILQKKRIHIVSFIIFSFFAFSSASRKAVLMIVFGVVVISVIHYGFRKIYKTLLMSVAVLMIAILALRLPYFSQVSERITKLLNGDQSASDYVRQGMIKYGIQLFTERPIFGYGIDNFKSMSTWHTYSHNNYIELMVSGGIIALVLYYLMFLYPAVGLLSCRRKGKKLDSMHLMLWVWLLMEMVFGNAMVQLYNKNSWLFAGVLMAAAVQASNEKRMLREKYNDTTQEN